MTIVNHRRRYTATALMVLFLFLTTSCESPVNSGTDAPEGPDDVSTRSFYMGFTPWPYRMDGDFNEILYTYDLIQDYGDIVAHHFQQGIPYPEAYAMRGSPVATGLPGYDGDDSDGTNHSLVYAEIDLRTGQTDVVDRVYLAIDTTNTGRDDLIGYYGEDYDDDGSTEQQPRPNNTALDPNVGGTEEIDWSAATFADQVVADAFVSYARAVIDEFNSRGLEIAYFNYASEISDLLLHDATEYGEFLVFVDRVYTALKVEYPSLPLMVSIALKHPDSADMQTIRYNIGALTDYVDVLGISVYPYAFFDPAIHAPFGLPSDWVSQITSLSGGKPVAFTETGWIAEDLTIPAYSLARTADESAQAAFTEALFAEADNLNAEFVVWFSLVDYSYFWENTLNSDPLSAIWRDTGILDYDGATDLNAATAATAGIAATPIGDAGLSERAAASVWTQWLGRERRQ